MSQCVIFTVFVASARECDVVLGEQFLLSLSLPARARALLDNGSHFASTSCLQDKVLLGVGEERAIDPSRFVPAEKK
jgi:hypothetical protein